MKAKLSPRSVSWQLPRPRVAPGNFPWAAGAIAAGPMEFNFQFNCHFQAVRWDRRGARLPGPAADFRGRGCVAVKFPPPQGDKAPRLPQIAAGGAREGGGCPCPAVSPRRVTLPAHDLGDVLGAGHGHALGHVHALLPARRRLGQQRGRPQRRGQAAEGARGRGGGRHRGAAAAAALPLP